MNSTEKGRVVFTATSDWYQIVSRDGELATSDGRAWGPDYETAADLAELDLDDHESWVVRVEEIDDRHSAIKVGDYVCCQGIGSEVVFVRLS